MESGIEELRMFGAKQGDRLLVAGLPAEEEHVRPASHSPRTARCAAGAARSYARPHGVIGDSGILLS